MANPITRIIISAVDRTKAAFASAKGGLTALGNAATSLKATLATVFAGFAVAGLLGALKQSIDKMNDVADAAERIGTSSENLSALGYAAQQSASSTDELEAGLTKLSRSLADARGGTGAAAEAFRALRIDPAQFSDPSDALLALADRFAAMPDGVEKASLAMDIFGKSGANLIPMLNNGRAGIEALKAEAAALGVVIGSDSAAAAAQFNDNMDKLKASGSGLGIQLANEILPGLTQISEAMVQAAKDGGVLKAAWVGLGGLGAALFTDDLVSNAKKLEKAQQDYNNALEAGVPREERWMRALETKIVVLKNAAAADEKAAEAEKQAAAESARLEDQRKAQNEEFARSSKERIADAEALRGALQDAFSASLKAEADYLSQAKKLRAEANKTDAPAADDVEGQARARLNAVLAAMKLQREASTSSLEDVKAQAESVRDLAGALGDAKLKQDLLNQANNAEAAALDKAAADEHARAASQAELLRQAEQEAAGIQTSLLGIKEPATVDIKPGAQVAQVKQDLTEIMHLINYIKENPVSVNVAGGGTAALKDSVKAAALQYGRR